MRRPILVLAMLLATATALADDAATCAAGSGTYLTGVVVDPPRFAHGSFRRGIELSHTHLRVRPDGRGQVYDVAIDNVFASGYDPAKATIPAPIDSIQKNDRVAVCGATYTTGGPGIHWVHPNCRGKSDPAHPNGFLKRIGPDGKASGNLESSTNYCSWF
ncbi:hypothetical protein [Massilia horti]|uniref:Uncharacterized protein n=1 Tax=Massilia horti TaxID=2562153 RepID=A0A4Y9SQM3_9BURK|nr:hypothetical protein [Massilia horti]TFW28881.1 hypothetical protein E4O92_19785 [Massilia horti]